MSQRNTRRLFLRECLSTGLVLTGTAFIFQGCSNPPEKEDKPPVTDKVSTDPCSDYTGLTEADLKARQSMGYVTKSPITDKQCSNCNLYLPPTEGKPCGKCQLFKGPVEPGGHCTYWAPQAEKPA
jgi:hypothetical protein